MPPAHQDPHRGYRRLTGSQAGEVAFQLVQAQSDLHIVASALPDVDLAALASQSLRAARSMIQTAIDLDPAFQPALTPLRAAEGAPALIQAMCEAATLCGVGPMAAVAGVVAEHVARALAAAGCRTALVENGGDLFLLADTPRVVAVLPDPSRLTSQTHQGQRDEKKAGLGLALAPDDLPCSICSSSATIGHSLSFGRAELVAVRSPSAAMADAAATALANRLRSGQDIPAVLRHAQTLAELPPPMRVEGVLAVCQGRIGAWGKVELTGC
ncbi:UPF0280 family protein [Megalodesulfovibrio paquesii]